MLTDVKTTTNANTQLVYITPTQAQAWLGNNDLNRNIRSQVVDMYARAMVEGRWQINGETIKISETGKLLDGQHRLSACVKAGVGFYSLVVGGLPEDYFATIDTGLSRTHGDVLGIAGIKGGYTIAAAIRTVKQIRAGECGDSNIRLSHDEALEFLRKEPFLERSFNAITRKASAVLPSSTCVALHYLFSEKDKVEADQFFTDLGTGAELSSSDSVYLLREKCLKSKRDPRAKLSKGEIITLAIRAWDHRRKSHETKVLKGSYRKNKDKKDPLRLPDIT